VSEIYLFPREEFIAERFRYNPGEHVTCLGPTGSGKTRLLNELAEAVVHPKLQGIALAAKPRDKTMTEWSERLKFRTVRTWPPPWQAWNVLGPDRNPPGWTLWPKHSFDPEVDDDHLYTQFRAALLWAYQKGNKVILADELLALTDLHLTRELRALWTRGRSMNAGLFGGSQKPTDIPTYAYGQAQHLLLANDPDERSRKRFSEIGGVDPKLVDRTVLSLDKYQWLYIRRDGPKMCIIDA